MIKNFNKALLAISVVGLGSVISAPAFAQTYASGSSTIVLMNGASQSVGAEISLPAGTYFTGTAGNGEVTVTPTLAGTLDTNTNSFDTLVVDPGLPDSLANLAPGASTTFTAAAAAQLDAAATLEEIVSIIRAGAGVDGLD
jgi:hypothetical protein